MLRNIGLIVVLLVASVSVAIADMVTLYPTDDSDVVQGYPDTNYGSDIDLTVGYHSSFGWANTLIKFDLSSYSGTTISSAYLRLYVYEALGDFPTDEIYNARNDADWDEATVTWSNKPGFAEITSITAPSTYDWWVIDVTSWVQDMVDGTDPNYGFQIFQDDTDWATIHMRSKEYTDNHPELVLDYIPVGIQSTSIGSIKAIFE